MATCVKEVDGNTVHGVKMKVAAGCNEEDSWDEVFRKEENEPSPSSSSSSLHNSPAESDPIAKKKKQEEVHHPQ